MDARLTSNATAREWQHHLTGIGRQALQGHAVEIANLQIDEHRIASAGAAFLAAVESVLSSATNAPRPAAPRMPEIVPLDDALASYMDAVAWCVGASLYMSDGADFLDELREESHAARDALRVLATTHWTRGVFMTAALKAETRTMGPAWRMKYASFSFLYDDTAARRAA